MTADQPDDRRRKPDHTRLQIWLAFAGTILAALIGGIFALLAAGGDNPRRLRRRLLSVRP